MFATGRFGAYRTRLHTGGAVKSGFDPVCLCFPEHLGRGLTAGPVRDVCFIRGENFNVFIFFHGSLLLIMAQRYVANSPGKIFKFTNKKLSVCYAARFTPHCDIYAIDLYQRRARLSQFNWTHLLQQEPQCSPIC